MLINPPPGYVYGVGDFTQFINLDSFVSNTVKYTWTSHGVGGPNIIFPYYAFYSFFSIVQSFASPQNMLIFYSLFFLFGSFFSFMFSLRALNLSKDPYVANITSTAYALNIYTLSRFFNPSPFYSLYVFFPALFALAYLFFLSKRGDMLCLAAFGIVLFIANMAFGNASYFISLNIVFALLVFLVYLLFKPGAVRLAFKAVSFFTVVFLISFASLAPQIPNLMGQFSKFQSLKSASSLNDWLFQSASFKDMLIFSDNIQADISTFGIPIMFSGAIIFIISILALANQLAGSRKHLLLLAVMILAMLFLTNKGNGILEKSAIIQLFAGNPALASLRSFDKTFIFLPFFCLLTINYFLIAKKSSIKWAVLILIVLSFIPLYPVFQGNLLKNYLGIDPGKDYTTSSYSRIIQIPPEYFNLANDYAYDKFDYRFLSLPYNSLAFEGWSIFPKWNYFGADITRQLFAQSILTVDQPSLLGEWNYGAAWNLQDAERSWWLLPYSGFFNAKFLIYHNDTAPALVNQTYDKINYYEKNGYIRKVNDTPYFSIYEVNDTYFLPRFYSSKNVIIVNGTPSLFPSISMLARQEGAPIYYFEGSSMISAISKLNSWSVMTFENSSVIKISGLRSVDWSNNVNVSDCSKDMVGAPKIGMQVSPDGISPEGSLELFSKNHYACVGTSFPVNITRGQFYQYTIYYKNVIGGKVSFGFVLHGKNRSYTYAETFNAPNHEWNRYDIAFSPEEDIIEFQTNLYAPSDGSNTIINRFDSISLDSVTPVPNDFSSGADAPPPVIEYKRINPTKYRIVIHRAKASFPLVFSEQFDENWRLYPVSMPDSSKIANLIPYYRILDGNAAHQATSSEVREMHGAGLISTLGDGADKTIQHKTWISRQYTDTARERFVVDFISKNYSGSIQNDNLPNGDLAETWLSKSIGSSTHLVANGYANSWIIAPYDFCNEQRCSKNSDGSYDFAMVVEYWPQNLLDIGGIISGIAFIACVAYVVYQAYIHRGSIRIRNS